MEPTDAQRASFELGIKFGSMYHQFAGTPVSLESAPALAETIEDSIENQPYCEEVTIDLRRDALEEAIDPSAGYTEFTGEFINVEILVEYEGHQATAVMEMDDGYPLMRLVSVE